MFYISYISVLQEKLYPKTYCNFRPSRVSSLFRRAHSSAGRALQWHCRGQRFDPAWVHHFSYNLCSGRFAANGFTDDDLSSSCSFSLAGALICLSISSFSGFSTSDFKPNEVSVLLTQETL